ncbi:MULTISPECIES: hypothetical protein [unclassified Nostoc]|uniref:hypothetical protein n=1 Tax=unclassified Nostoc TaxID=2593658 RepID=UPI0025AA782A|nr:MULTISPECIES: hypothetical protein [unclassified Nostoc]MDM9582647.1 hypothetical protein [Nostoc sp. GT001]MDZ7943967.1 hypothetical protein [Nostoc sp. EfeVER01]MDZ7992318.1 hypothetical protein [Nostoc sp. EspVER01]
MTTNLPVATEIIPMVLQLQPAIARCNVDEKRSLGSYTIAWELQQKFAAMQRLYILVHQMFHTKR